MNEVFHKAWRELNESQRKAAETIDGPVLVIAGPGTGKTQLLTVRVANILDKTDSLPSNILCLTFTDSAALTMRERLSSIIGPAAYDVTISTYHAFGSDLIRKYPDYFLKYLDLEPADDLTINQVMREIITGLSFANPLRHDVFLNDLITFISDCKRALLTPEAIKKVALSNEVAIQHMTTVAGKVLKDFVRLDKKSAPLFRDLYVPEVDKAKHLPEAVVDLGALWNQQLATALQTFEETGKTSALRQWKDQWLTKDENGTFITTSLPKNHKLAAAADIYEAYLKGLAKRGLYDYDDMILQAITGLRTNPELRYSLQERYLYILLDEFQDTNEAQLQLVELLTDSPVNEGRPNIMAVGDDDQAIYAFQGANYSHMLRFYGHYRDVAVVPITRNYRSQPEIISLSNAIAGQIEDRLQAYLSSINKTISSVFKPNGSNTKVERYHFKSDLTQYAWVAKQVHDLRVSGIPGHEIAVLAPKHQYLEILVPFLHQQQVPVHYDKRDNILDDPSVNELITMSLLVVAMMTQQTGLANSLWPQVLSFNFWQLPTEVIWQSSWNVQETDRDWTTTLLDNELTKPIAWYFIRLSQVAVTTGLEEMMDYLIGTTPLPLGPQQEYQSPFYEHYFKGLTNQPANTDYWQLLSNLTVLRQDLRDYRVSDDGPLRIDDFLSFVESHRTANIKILNTNPYQESADAVELMTVYKAKGQEFTAVFLLGCLDEIWGGRARNSGSRLSLPDNLAFIRYAGTTEDERLRLLYVGLTRAKTKLFLTSYEQTYSGRLMNSLKYLQEYRDDKGHSYSPLLPAKNRRIKTSQDEMPVIDELATYWHDRHLSEVQKPTLKSLLQPRLKYYQLSPTDVNLFTDVARNGPANLLLSSLLRFPFAPTPSGQFGSAIHKTLEWIHRDNQESKRIPSAKQVITYFRRNLARQHLDKALEALLIERGERCLRAYLQQRQDTIKTTNYHEYNFRHEGIFIGPAHLSGKVDKLLVDAKAKTITIVDYKTGKSFKRWTNTTKLHAYKQQLYIYKLLVEHSQIFRGYRVIDAYLEFVEPDENGRIHELHLVYEPDYEKFTEALIISVWQHIQKLRFPDITSYAPDVKGIEAFQHDLINHVI